MRWHKIGWGDIKSTRRRSRLCKDWNGVTCGGRLDVGLIVRMRMGMWHDMLGELWTIMTGIGLRIELWVSVGDGRKMMRRGKMRIRIVVLITWLLKMRLRLEVVRMGLRVRLVMRVRLVIRERLGMRV